ncbi:uncharacterized protein BX664DRAFT_236784, partial [Halteromyces radiatus]|uniref:uncharacterized protein n=1 Tax=Halteromyces radiatus TaxID=101107 RepID=UPI002221101A
TWQYNDACQSIYLFCDPSTSKCNYIGCTNADYTKGWMTSVRPYPPRCGNNTYCPDNRSKCMPTVPTNAQCEMQRDDECQGSNSICLNGVCNVKAVPLGGKCGNDTTQYVSNDAEGNAELQTIVRDNCTDGTYCVNQACITSKVNGATCSQDRECISNTCSPDGVCVNGPDVFHQIANWLWGVIGAAIVVFILIVLLLLWALQRYQSKKEHQKIGKFFGDNEDFAKYAMLEHDDDSYYDDTTGLQPPPSIGLDNKRASMVYLTTPDYAKSSSLSLAGADSRPPPTQPLYSHPRSPPQSTQPPQQQQQEQHSHHQQEHQLQKQHGNGSAKETNSYYNNTRSPLQGTNSIHPNKTNNTPSIPILPPPPVPPPAIQKQTSVPPPYMYSSKMPPTASSNVDNYHYYSNKFDQRTNTGSFRPLQPSKDTLETNDSKMFRRLREYNDLMTWMDNEFWEQNDEVYTEKLQALQKELQSIQDEMVTDLEMIRDQTIENALCFEYYQLTMTKQEFDLDVMMIEDEFQNEMHHLNDVLMLVIDEHRKQIKEDREDSD